MVSIRHNQRALSRPLPTPGIQGSWKILGTFAFIGTVAFQIA